MKALLSFTKKSFYEFSLIVPARHGAALAYYGIFALAPVIFITVELATFFLKDVAGVFLTQIVGLLGETIGPEFVTALEYMLVSVAKQASEDTVLLTILGVLGVLYVGAGAFAQLKYSLNAIWDVPPEKEIGILPFVMARLLGMAVVLGLGLLFIVLIILNVLLNTLSSYLDLPSNVGLISLMIFVLLMMITFAILYRFLPDTDVAWQDVWSGAILAAVLIGLGLAIAAWLLQNTRLSPALAASGSFVLILVSINYISQIFLFGAVVTKVYSVEYGSRSNNPEIDANVSSKLWPGKVDE